MCPEGLLIGYPALNGREQLPVLHRGFRRHTPLEIRGMALGASVRRQRDRSPSPPFQFRYPDAQRRAHLLVEHEEMLCAFAFRGEAPVAVEPIHRAVERPMGTP